MSEKEFDPVAWLAERYGNWPTAWPRTMTVFWNQSDGSDAEVYGGTLEDMDYLLAFRRNGTEVKYQEWARARDAKGLPYGTESENSAIRDFDPVQYLAERVDMWPEDAAVAYVYYRTLAPDAISPAYTFEKDHVPRDAEVVCTEVHQLQWAEARRELWREASPLFADYSVGRMQNPVKCDDCGGTGTDKSAGTVCQTCNGARFVEHGSPYDRLLADFRVAASIEEARRDQQGAEDYGSPYDRLLADFRVAAMDPSHPYYSLAGALLGAYGQAAFGKGKARHANDLPFTEQPMQAISDLLGCHEGMAYQVCKKVQEAMRMEPAARIAELKGAIVYTAGIIVRETRLGEQPEAGEEADHG